MNKIRHPSKYCCGFGRGGKEDAKKEEEDRWLKSDIIIQHFLAKSSKPHFTKFIVPIVFYSPIKLTVKN